MRCPPGPTHALACSASASGPHPNHPCIAAVRPAPLVRSAQAPSAPLSPACLFVACLACSAVLPGQRAPPSPPQKKTNVLPDLQRSTCRPITPPPPPAILSPSHTPPAQATLARAPLPQPPAHTHPFTTSPSPQGPAPSLQSPPPPAPRLILTEPELLGCSLPPSVRPLCSTPLGHRPPPPPHPLLPFGIRHPLPAGLAAAPPQTHPPPAATALQYLMPWTVDVKYAVSLRVSMLFSGVTV